MSKNKFKVFNDKTAACELEAALKNGNDLVLVSSPSEYFESGAGQNAIGLMKKYPKRKIFVTSPASASIWEQVCKKADSGADILSTSVYAEGLAKARCAI